MSREVRALQVSCPRCKAKAGAPCTYVPSGYTLRQSPPNTPRGRMMAERVGTPTKRPHNERLVRLGHNEHVRSRREEIRRIAAETPAALFSLREFDRREHERMRVWLKANAAIFWRR